MNKLTYCFLGLGTMLFASSCTQDDGAHEDNGLKRSVHEKVNVTSRPLSPTTRISTERDGNVTHFNWNKGDAIALATTNQQLPYITTVSGATASFLSAFSGSENESDYLANEEGQVVYARYPYDTDKKIDMKTLKTPISQDEPFLYAVDTIVDGQLGLHFHHAFAYLRLEVSFEGFTFTKENQPKLEMELNYEDDDAVNDIFPFRLFNPVFNYATYEIEYSSWDDDWDLTPAQYEDTSRLYAVRPLPEGYFIYFSMEENYDVYDYIFKSIPTGGLKAGHIYTIKLPFRAVRDERWLMTHLFIEGNGNEWTNKTNWLSDKPYGEWYGVTVDAEGHVTGIDLSGNNFKGRPRDIDLSFCPYLTKFCVDNNSFDALELTGSNNMADFSLNNCNVRDQLYCSFDKVDLYKCEITDLSIYSITSSVKSCTIRGEFGASCDSLYIEESECLQVVGMTVSKQLHVKNSTLGMYHSAYNPCEDDADVILENVTLKDNSGEKESVSVTCTIKGSEWTTLFDSTSTQTTNNNYNNFD